MPETEPTGVPWIDGDRAAVVARLAQKRDERPGRGGEYAAAIGMIDGLSTYDTQPVAWRMKRIRLVLEALDEVTGVLGLRGEGGDSRG